MKKTITRRSLLAALASFSFFIPTTALSAKGRELAIFYSFSGNSKRVAEVFQKLEHCDVLEIKTLEPYNAYNAREDRKKKKLPLISPLDIDLDCFQKIVLIFSCLGVHACFADAKLHEGTFTKQRSRNYFRRCRTARRNV